MPYYLAVKINESKNEFLLLTSTPCIIPWDDEITTISFADPRLISKMKIITSYNYPIYACSSPSQIMYAISLWLETATWNEIILLTRKMIGNKRVMNLVTPVLRKILMNGFSHIIRPSDVFCVDQMYYAYVTRRWAIGAQSSPAWKKLFVSNIDDSTNSLIRIAKLIVSNPVHSDGSDNYNKLCEDDDYVKMLKEEHNNSFEEFLSHMSTKKIKPYMEQFLGWVNANYASMPTMIASRIFNMCVHVISNQDAIPRRTPLVVQNTIPPKYTLPSNEEMSSIITNLNFLKDIEQDSLFVEYITGLLTCEKYIYLLQVPGIMRHLSQCMQKYPIYTSLIAYAMSFAMFYVTQLEFTASSTSAHENAPYVFTHDMVHELPRFSDPLCYVPISVKHVNLNVPFHVPGERVPVATEDIAKRLNIATVRDSSRFDIVKDIPWKKMNIILSGSRYSSACWVGPREREQYGGNYLKYISDYIGTSENELDAILENLDPTGNPLLDIVGRNFLSDPCDQKDQTPPIPSEEKKAAAKINDAYSLDKIMKYLSDAAISSSLGESKAPEVPTLEVKEIKEEPILINEPVRETFMKMKYSSTLFGNHTDIDIGFIGTSQAFDSAAADLVMHLRKFGKAVGLRFQKARSYTWVIITSFLKHTIDFFHAGDSALGLILRYMTSYPRAWFDGISHMCTADYICARMSGINNRYIYTMNDPIYTMMKIARKEDISILLNYGEQGMLRKWLEVNMPGIKLVLGNVSMNHEFFGRVGPWDNDKKIWIHEIPMMPKSRVVLSPWTNENAEPLRLPRGILEPISGKKIRPADPSVFTRYMAEINEISSKNVIYEIPIAGR